MLHVTCNTNLFGFLFVCLSCSGLVRELKHKAQLQALFEKSHNKNKKMKTTTKKNNTINWILQGS